MNETQRLNSKSHSLSEYAHTSQKNTTPSSTGLDPGVRVHWDHVCMSSVPRSEKKFHPGSPPFPPLCKAIITLVMKLKHYSGYLR